MTGRRHSASPANCANHRDPTMTTNPRGPATLALAAADADAAGRTGSIDALAKLIHELRTPLHGMLGMAGLLLRDPTVAARHRAHLALIRECGQHQLQMIDDLLDFARLHARTIEIHRQPTDLARLLRFVADTLRVNAEAKGLALRLHLSPLLPGLAQVDAKRLTQVLFNLGGNAIKYTDQGSVDLHADLRHDGADASLVLRVADTGRGMPQEMASGPARLFQRANGLADLPSGSGIGLIVCHELVQLMGGQLGFHSQPGLGTVAELALPL